VLPDLNQFSLITDRLAQAHANFQVLARLAKNQLSRDPALSVNGRPAWGSSETYYWGASDGGIQGTTFLALSPEITRGVLNVPGSEWSLMLYRSSNFTLFTQILGETYSDKLDVQVLVAISQLLWDRTDPIEFAPHLLEPLPGAGPKKALFQESYGDAQVPNVTTEIEMRTIGAQALGPLAHPVFGLTELTEPTSDLVFTQWDVRPSPIPQDVNTPPNNNSAHDAVRKLPAAIAQAKAFLAPSGKVVNTCPGACVFPGAN
jgi:hypothetical protein